VTTAAIYVRVSTEDQARHGYSLSSQADACRTRAQALGALEIRTYADEGVSGALLSRPGLDALREAIRSKAVDLMVVWDPDRLSRNLSHQLLITEEIERAKVRLEFVNFEWKATPEGQLFYALRGAIAQYEKEKIRERTSRGRLQKARSGKLPLAFQPYGYRYDVTTALLVPDHAEAEVVRRLFRLFLNDGLGPAAIADRINALGTPARKGGAWHRAVVRQILANPVYTGIFWTNRWDTAGCSLNRHRPPEDRVTATQRPEAEWVPVAVPALISPEVWQEARTRLTAARRLWAGKPRAEYLLSGLLVCGPCGGTMSGVTATDWGIRRRKYTCRRRGDPARCGRAVAADPLEAAVWEAVLTWLADPEALAEALEGAQERRAHQERELESLTQAEAQAEKGRAGILAVLEQGLMPPAEATAALARLRQRADALQHRRRELEASPPPPGCPPLFQEWVATCIDHYHRGGLPPDERRQLVRTVLTRVLVGEQTLSLYAKLHKPS